MYTRTRTAHRWRVAASLALVAAGCGGGNNAMAPVGPPPVTEPARQRGLARFDVDVATGKVTITNEESADRGRAVLTGGAVSFTSSDLLSVGGDSGKRMLRIRATNNSSEPYQDGRIILSNLSNSAAINYRAETRTAPFVGSGAAGALNGYAGAAQFRQPSAVVATPIPNDFGTEPLHLLAYFVSDTANHTIRKVYADGTVTTFAGAPGVADWADGVGGAARFDRPGQLAVDQTGNLFVADTGNHCIRRINPNGEVTTIAGIPGFPGGVDGPGDESLFDSPLGIAVNSNGDTIFVSDTGNDAIRRVTLGTDKPKHLASSYQVDVLAGTGFPGFQDGGPDVARFRGPGHIALLTIDNFLIRSVLAVADTGNNAIRAVSNIGLFSTPKVETWAGNGVVGNTDGLGNGPRFRQPFGVTPVQASPSGSFVLETDALIVSERGNHRLRMVRFRGNESSQRTNYEVVTLAGNAAGFKEGDGNTALFNAPLGVCAVKASGPSATVLLADSNNNRVRKVILSSELLHSGGPGTNVAETVRLLTFDAEMPKQIASAWALNLPGGDSPALTIQFYVPSGVSGFTFTAYVEANTGGVNLPAAGASWVTTIAGDGKAGDAEGPGNVAQFTQPSAVLAVPPNYQNLYAGGTVRAFVLDTANSRVRAVGPNGSVRTFVGSVPGFNDGGGTLALFRVPRGIAMAPDGSLLIADTGNLRSRRVTPGGVVTTIAGDGAAGADDGTGDQASFTRPVDVTADPGGLIYVLDQHGVRRVKYVLGDPAAPQGYVVSTVAGSVTTPGSVNGVGAAARFRAPEGITSGVDGRLYVADTGNHIVRILTRASVNALSVATLAGLAGAPGTADGLGGSARFTAPTGISADAAHNVYVSDAGSHRIRRVSPVGAQGQVTTLIGGAAGFADGAAGTFRTPRGIGLEARGTLLVADSGNHSLRAVHRLIAEAPAR